RRMTADEMSTPSGLPEGARVFRLGDITSQRQARPSGPGSAMHFPVHVDGQDYFPPGTRGWSTTQAGMERLVAAGRIVARGQRLMTRHYDFYQLMNPDIGVKGGFQYKTVPHISVESIAKNPEVDRVSSKHQPDLDTVRSALNKAVGQSLEHSEIPKEAPGEWP